ncbi:MAG: barnase inhibitor [Desulfobacca sp.]|nr:barnase inhibitor [Desulfobacca sp.]
MPIKRCILNGFTMGSLADLYDQLTRQLSLPKHFGGNLDALWDVLSADMEGPFEIVWRHSDESNRTMGKDFERVLKVLQDLEKERKDFKLKIEP